MQKTKLCFAAAVGLGLAFPGAASAADGLTKVAFGTNWVAEAEHGGFYQAVVDGSYAACGLEVEIVPGGPQVNNRALMLAGKLDFYMGGDLLNAFAAIEQGVPLKVIAGIMQKHPQAFMTHPGVAEKFEDLTDLTIMVGQLGMVSFYKWMMASYGFTEDQRVPYTFNAAPFIVDKGKAMQGYVTAEPYAVETQGGFAPDIWLLADYGYATYATTIETMAETFENRPEIVKCFVDASILGWYNYLYGDNAAANAMIKEQNPDMTDGQIQYSIDKMIEFGIIDSGDAETMGIGVMTPERVNQFYQDMIAAGVVDPGLDLGSVVDTSLVGHGVGLDVKSSLGR